MSYCGNQVCIFSNILRFTPIKLKLGLKMMYNENNIPCEQDNLGVTAFNKDMHDLFYFVEHKRDIL